MSLSISFYLFALRRGKETSKERKQSKEGRKERRENGCDRHGDGGQEIGFQGSATKEGSCSSWLSSRGSSSFCPL